MKTPWILGLTILVGIVYAFAFLAFWAINKDLKIGLGQFSRTPEQIEKTVSKRIAPAPFYYKQRTFRISYGLLRTFDTLLLVTSLLYSAITAYLILDKTVMPGETILCLVIATLASTLKGTLRLDRIAIPYIEAVRILEKAILRYEYEPDKSLENLLAANEEAEVLIQNKNE